MFAHLLSEFVGTSILIGTIAKSGQLLWIVVAFAVAVYVTSPFSGGHLNPAVTLWAYSKGKIGMTRAIHHIIGQVAAALSVVYLA